MVIFYFHSNAFKKRQRLTFIFLYPGIFLRGWGEVAYRRNNEFFSSGSGGVFIFSQ